MRSEKSAAACTMTINYPSWRQHSRRETFITYFRVSDTVMQCLITRMLWHCYCYYCFSCCCCCCCCFHSCVLSFFINSPSSRLFCRYILFLHRIFARYRIFSCKCFFFIQRLFIYLVWSASTLQTLQSGFQRLLLLFLSFYAAADKIIWLEYSNRCLEKMWTIYFVII